MAQRGGCLHALSPPALSAPSPPPKASPGQFDRALPARPLRRRAPRPHQQRRTRPQHIREALRVLARPQSKRSSTAGAIRPPLSRRSTPQPHTFLFLGRGIHYAIAREGALKAEGSLLRPRRGLPHRRAEARPQRARQRPLCHLVVLATVDQLARAASVLALREDSAAPARHEDPRRARHRRRQRAAMRKFASLVRDCVPVDPCRRVPAADFAEVVPLQLFAYFMALARGVDVDRPRNFSKAVVEQGAAN
jgi:hypothetical protein